MQDTVWFCTCCSNQQIEGQFEGKICSKCIGWHYLHISWLPGRVLEICKLDVDLATFDINLNVSNENKLACHWFQEPTDPRIILNFCSFALLQRGKNVIQRTVCGIFTAKIYWFALNQALEQNNSCLTKNQHPDEWIFQNSQSELRKNNNWQKSSMGNNTDMASKNQTGSHDKSKNFLDYNGNHLQNLAKNWGNYVTCKWYS